MYGFGDHLYGSFKSFEERLDDKVRKKLSELSKNKDEGTALTPALKGVFENINSREEDKKFLFVLTDGEPNNEGAAKELIKNIAYNSSVNLLGIGLGSGTEMVKDLFSKELPHTDNLPNLSVKRLAKVLANKIKELMSK